MCTPRGAIQAIAATNTRAPAARIKCLASGFCFTENILMRLTIRMQRATVDGFSGHSDRKQLMRYISSLEPKPDKIVIGHGEDRKCTDLASSIYKKFGIETKAPQNLETIRLK